MDNEDIKRQIEIINKHKKEMLAHPDKAKEFLNKVSQDLKENKSHKR